MKFINTIYKSTTLFLNYFGIVTGFNSWTGYIYHTTNKEVMFRISRSYNLDIEGRFERKLFSEEQIEIMYEFGVSKSCLGIMIKYNWFNNTIKIMNRKGEWI